MLEADSRDVIVVGAGISGLCAARSLTAKGLGVTVLEKGRGFGGRLATRRMEGARIDHGAQFMTSRDEAFADLLNGMLEDQAVTKWHENDYAVMRYRGAEGMSSIGKYLAKGLDVRREHLVVHIEYQAGEWAVSCENGKTFKSAALLSTIPMPQFLALVEQSDLAMNPLDLTELAKIRYEPSIAILALLETSSKLQVPGILKFEDHPLLDTIADNQLKGISEIPAATIHCSSAFSREHLDFEGPEFAKPVVEAAKEYLGVGIKQWKPHRWRYAQCIENFGADFFMAAEFPLWLAGDGFLPKRIEEAALSGLRASESIARSLS